MRRAGEQGISPLMPGARSPGLAACQLASWLLVKDTALRTQERAKKAGAATGAKRGERLHHARDQRPCKVTDLCSVNLNLRAQGNPTRKRLFQGSYFACWRPSDVPGAVLIGPGLLLISHFGPASSCPADGGPGKLVRGEEGVGRRGGTAEVVTGGGLQEHSLAAELELRGGVLPIDDAGHVRESPRSGTQGVPGSDIHTRAPWTCVSPPFRRPRRLSCTSSRPRRTTYRSREKA